LIRSTAEDHTFAWPIFFSREEQLAENFFKRLFVYKSQLPFKTQKFPEILA
jgi:hypothetical protein